MKKLLYLTSLIATLSCASGSHEQAENRTLESTADTLTKTDSVVEKESSAKDIEPVALHSDTLVLDKKSVIFFMLNQQEYDSLMTASGDDATDVNEGFADFEYYATKVSQQMQTKGVDSDFVAHKVFKIVTADGIEYFNRKVVPDADMGIIIFDGETKPTIQTGVMTDVDFMTLIEEKIK